jgi:hypothetical protein
MKERNRMKSSEAKAIQATDTPRVPPTSNSSPSSSASPSDRDALTFEDLRILRAPFPKESLGIKVQSLNKERTRAMLVLYLQHTDVQDRLDQVDPTWTLEALREERVGDRVYVYLKMTVKGIARENVGDGGDPKAAYSDALKRCAMLFGVGRYLYGMNTVWADYNEQRDRFKNWTIEDYEQAARGRSQVPLPSPVQPQAQEPPAVARDGAVPVQPGLKTNAAVKKPVRTREQLNRLLMTLYRPYLTKYPETRFVELLQTRYNVGETRLMSLEQIEDLLQFMEQQLESAA